MKETDQPELRQLMQTHWLLQCNAGALDARFLNDIALANATCQLLEQMQEVAKQMLKHPQELRLGKTMDRQYNDDGQLRYVLEPSVYDLPTSVYSLRKKLEPLANSYGFRILPHVTLVGMGRLNYISDFELAAEEQAAAERKFAEACVNVATSIDPVQPFFAMCAKSRSKKARK